jgi:predicted AAA+ superfamily ATPase
MLVPRYIKDLSAVLPEGKVLIIYGPRRVGKTTLIQMLLEGTDLKYRIDSGDNIRIRNILNSEDFNLIREYASGYDLIVIDEAQQIEGIGRGLKIMVDQIPHLKIVATGSSSFNLEQQIGEPLYPLSMQEMTSIYNRFELKEKLELFLVYGSYPEVFTAGTTAEKRELLVELVDSYLLKDVLGFDRLRSPKQLLDLLKLLAFQVGHEVSVHELATKIGLNVRTVERYLHLLEKGFVLYRIGAYSKNLRSEITKKAKYYFFDNGIRNGIIRQFNPPDLRNDIGQLWENFLVSERLKYLHYNRIFANRYFWRSYRQNEIDYLEEVDNKLAAFEFKWGKSSHAIPREFTDSYGEVDHHIINRENYLDFLL